MRSQNASRGSGRKLDVKKRGKVIRSLLTHIDELYTRKPSRADWFEASE